MPQTIEVRFKGLRRGFFTWPEQEEPLRLKEAVVVEVEKGQDFGRVASTGAAAISKCGGCSSCATPEPAAPDGSASGEPADAPVPPPAPEGLRPVLRRASQEDIRAANELRRHEEEVRLRTIERVRQHQLEMRISDTEWQWDRNKLTVYFTAEKRVDFRALVRELASQYRTRIELRQIGVRDEAARLGGVGRCGREFCCSTWLKELTPVSLALAKDQHLSLNPSQISGGCGRLLCCLKYEHDFYVESRKRFPREGKTVQAARGAEKVVAVDIFRERVFLRSDDQGARIIPLEQLLEELASPQPAVAPPVAPRPERHEPRRPSQRRPERPPAPPAAPVSPPPAAAATPGPAEPGAPGESRRPRRRRRGRRRRPDRGDGAPPSPPSPQGG
jgi:cell fate regulator YaaT (PSP1 superfamily)